jgi:hypothetical protein
MRSSHARAALATLVAPKLRVRLERVTRSALPFLTIFVVLSGVGCASARVKPENKAPMDVQKPDFLIIERFAVSQADVKLDRGVSAKMARGLVRSPSLEERHVGAAVAAVLEEELVRQLRQAGISAYVDSYAPTATDSTAVVAGHFVTVDEGDRTQRVLIGFGLGGSKLRMRYEIIQGESVAANGEVSTSSSLKPGILPAVGVGAAAGTVVVSAAISGTAAVASEALLQSVEADAKRAAKAAADSIIQGYKKRGWL